MKKKLLLIIIPIVLVIIIISAIIIAILLNKKDEEEEISTGSTWGDTYYAYLKEAIDEKDLTDAEEKYGMILDMTDAKLQFCEVDQEQSPAMIMTYKKNESQYVNVYQINNENKVTYVSYKQPAEINYLYNIERNEYSWYVHTNDTNSESYISLKNIVNNLKSNSQKSDESDNVNISELEADYTINKEEAETTQETVDGNTLTLSKFDEIFVNPEITANKQFDFDVNIKKDELQDQIKMAVEDYQKESEKLTEEIKEQVSKKVEEINAKKQEIETAKQELESKKAAEEEAKKGLKIGNYTIKYGKYVMYVDDTKLDEVLQINADGTCQYTAQWERNGISTRSFTYKIGQYDFSQDINPDYREGIILSYEDGTVMGGYYPLNNTTLAGSGLEVYRYSGENTSTSSTTSSSNTQTNSSSNTTNTTGTTSTNTNSQSSSNQLTSFEYDTSANNPISTGTYYRDKDTGVQSILEIKNSTGNSFEFSISAIYMTQAGYPNMGELTGTAKAIKGGSYVYTYSTGDPNGYGYDYNVFFRIAGGESNPTITIEDECYLYNSGKTELSPFCGHNVTFEGTYSK